VAVFDATTAHATDPTKMRERAGFLVSRRAVSILGSVPSFSRALTYRQH
jgi:hypothetical protein